MELLRNLSNNIPFYCRGVIDNPAILFYKDKNNNPQAIDFPANKIDCDKLIANCNPAIFGLGNKDVLDTNYRYAFSMEKDKFSTTFQPTDYDIINDIEKILLPDGGKVRPILDKINIYSEGGYFKNHLDTPKDSTMFGTLVVSLPSKFTGGNLVLNNTNIEWMNDSHKKIQWVAFFGDINHEVEIVTSGYRITLTYILFKKRNCLFDVHKFISISYDDLKNQVIKDLKNHSLSLKDKTIGFGCKYMYSYPSEQKNKDYFDYIKANLGEAESYSPWDLIKYSSNNLNKNIIPEEILKGCDALLYMIFKSLDLNPRLESVIIHTNHELRGNLDNGDSICIFCSNRNLIDLYYYSGSTYDNIDDAYANSQIICEHCIDLFIEQNIIKSEEKVTCRDCYEQTNKYYGYKNNDEYICLPCKQLYTNKGQFLTTYKYIPHQMFVGSNISFHLDEGGEGDGYDGYKNFLINTFEPIDNIKWYSMPTNENNMIAGCANFVYGNSSCAYEAFYMNSVILIDNKY